uniref:Uncharacterized protein n=1 Tax=Pararge aegeria TaxID=116150 RepID=S4P4T0_9NEOP
MLILDNMDTCKWTKRNIPRVTSHKDGQSRHCPDRLLFEYLPEHRTYTVTANNLLSHSNYVCRQFCLDL